MNLIAFHNRGEPNGDLTTEPVDQPAPDVCPAAWEAVAELRVFRTVSDQWVRLISWRAEMRRKGWRLLRVTTDGGQIIAVFGRTREKLAGNS